jgi:beta-glucosidase
MVNTIIDPAYVLGQMSIEEKIALLSGDDMWHTVPIPRLGVPRVRCSDGPVSLIVVSLD